MVAERIAGNVLARIAHAAGAGLGYLSLERSTPSLSPGELQRLRLATQIRSNLFGVVTCSTNPPPACIPPTARPCCDALEQLRAGRQQPVRGRARPGGDARRRLAGRRRPRRRGTAAACSTAVRRPGCADVPASHTRAFLFAPAAPRARPPAHAAAGWSWKASAAQPAGLDVRIPLGCCAR
jgi:excinuclease ABC subunit A